MFIIPIAVLVIVMIAAPIVFFILRHPKPAKGVFAGSFDLMHGGHADFMALAATRCQELVILIALNPWSEVR